MPIGALGLAAIAQGAGSLAQGIFGGVQAARANKAFSRLQANRPTYDIPKEYENVLRQYQLAYASDMPGYAQTLSNIGQASARARGAAERGAISSNAYGAQVGDIYQKELDAIQNLGIQQAQYKQSQLANIAQAEQTIGGQKLEQQNWNKFIPWQTEMNRFGEQKQAGIQNMFSGIQSGLGNLTDYMGTKYYTDAIKGLYPQNNNIDNRKPFSVLGNTYNPQENLIDTTKRMLQGIPINYPIQK